MKEGLTRQGLEPQTGTPEQFAAFIHNEVQKNARLIKIAGVKGD